MFRWQSEQTCEVSETAVMLDILRKGWICQKWSRDSPIDLLVDMGENNFSSVQVKSFTGHTIPTITRNEPDGKRNTSLYKDFAIDWIVGYQTITEKIYYYHIDKYGPLDGKSINIRKMPPDNFPIWIPPLHSSSDRNKTLRVDTAGPLEAFMAGK